MSSKNVETVERFFELLNKNAVDEAIDLLDPDLVADFSRSINPDAKGIYRGRDEVRTFLKRFLDAWGRLEWFADEYIEEGERVVRIGGIRARGKGSGVEVTGGGAQVWAFRDSRPVQMAMFQNKAEALEHIREP